jgi:predicted component of viral defense system (DUF524 family)
MDPDILNDSETNGFRFHGIQIARILESGQAPATHYAFEWTEYWLSYPDAVRIEVGSLELLPTHGEFFRLRFENQLGLAELRGYNAVGRLLGTPLTLLVISPKFPSLEHHRAFYEPLLGDLFDQLARLPFIVSGPTAQQVEEARHPPSPIFALHFLTHEAERISHAMRVIQAAPHRRMTVEEELRPIHAVTAIDPDALIELAQTPGRWRDAPRSQSPLARRLRGKLPETIWQSISRETLDTPENRFVLGAIRQFGMSLTNLLGQSWWASIPTSQRVRLSQLGGAIERFLIHPEWREVGRFGRAPTSSRVLLRKDGYRDLFALWEQYQRARRPLFAALDAAMSVRDVATLYEYWVYYRLIDELREITGEEPVLDLKIDALGRLGWSGTARFGNVGSLVYNPSMSAYSGIGLRPDMVWRPTYGRPVAFDAKFRMQLTASGDDKWKDDDLVKMHAYRDALDVRAAVAIYPGDWSRFWSDVGTPLSTTINHVVEEDLVGVGAIARTPGE